VTELTPDQRAEIVERHLRDHGHLAPERLEAAVAAADDGSGDGPSPALGARIVARAWADPAFRRRLLTDAVAAVAEYHTQTVPLMVLEDTAGVHNVIVCTLCSCYPGGILGDPPAWYKSFEYRSRVVREPRAVLAEFGMVLGDDVELRVYDSTAELRYLVLPLRPAGSDGLPEERLAALVTRNSMIGTGWPLAPGDGTRPAPLGGG
jgi:nitrile hydratase